MFYWYRIVAKAHTHYHGLTQTPRTHSLTIIVQLIRWVLPNCCVCVWTTAASDVRFEYPKLLATIPTDAVVFDDRAVAMDTPQTCVRAFVADGRRLLFFFDTDTLLLLVLPQNWYVVVVDVVCCWRWRCWWLRRSARRWWFCCSCFCDCCSRTKMCVTSITEMLIYCGQFLCLWSWELVASTEFSGTIREHCCRPSKET